MGRGTNTTISRISSRTLSVSSIEADEAERIKLERSKRRFCFRPGTLVRYNNEERPSGDGLRRSWLLDGLSFPVLYKEHNTRVSLRPPIVLLPVEIQLQIITNLIYSDIITLRKTCRAFNDVILSNEHYIARQQLQIYVEPRLQVLYPPESSEKPTFAYLSKLASKSVVASELSKAMATHLFDGFQNDFFYLDPSLDARVFIIRYMSEKLRFSFLILQHFLDNFGERKLRVDELNGFPSRANDLDLQERLMQATYTDEQIVSASDHYRLVLFLLWRILDGPEEKPLKRLLKRFRRHDPAEKILTTFLIVGGLAAVRDIYRSKSEASRKRAIWSFIYNFREEQRKSTGYRTNNPIKLARSFSARNVHLNFWKDMPPNVKRYSRMHISNNIYHLWLHPSQQVMARRRLIPAPGHYKYVEEIVSSLCDGWEQWAYGEGEVGGHADESDDEE